ncbi:MAG TPA: hypothetical protein VF184_06680 [Phycisphaeraceae bacterium]
MNDRDHATLALAKRDAAQLDIRIELRPDDRDGFEIRRDTEGRWVIIGNNPRSCLWGVYHLQAGGGEGEYHPRFAIRGINVCETLGRHSPEMVTRLIGRMARWRMNTLVVHHAYGYRRHAALIQRLCAQRGIDLIHYLQAPMLFLSDRDAEFFAKTRDGRLRTPTLANETRLCASDPRAVDRFTVGLSHYLGGDHIQPGDRVVLIDADGYLFCECPACRCLPPHEQWAKLFEAAQDVVERLDKRLSLHYLAYVWRYRVPAQRRMIERLDGVMFDTHQRYRWRSIGQPHDLTAYNQIESQADQRAQHLPLNIYLHERLREWRRACAGELYVFENLMLHGSISCPQPYTPQLLADLDLYEREGVDGVIYEAFEPGIASFADQLGVLSRAAWSDRPAYTSTRLERLCCDLREEDCPAYHFKNCFNVLSYLTTDRFDGLAALREHLNDPALWDYARYLQRFLRQRSPAHLEAVLAHVLAHRDRFDWMFIAFNLVRAVQPPMNSSALPTILQQFLTCDKLHDLIEPMADPASTIAQVIEQLRELLESVDRGVDSDRHRDMPTGNRFNRKT